MGYFNEFPHTRGYDGDLGYLIKMYKELITQYQTLNEYYENLSIVIQSVVQTTINELLESNQLLVIPNLNDNRLIEFNVNKSEV